MQKAFVKVDVDGSGRLSFKDMKKVIEALSSEEEKSSPEFDQMATMICNMADVNGDKMIDFGEILMMFFGDSMDPKNTMKTMFRAYDTNGDGYIDKKEIKEFMKASGQEADPAMARVMMAMADEDDDGKLNYKEFVAMVDR